MDSSSKEDNDYRGCRFGVLDKGYVRLVNYYEDGDLDIVNAARVSYDKESLEFKKKDEMLMKYLAEHDHTSPFRHAFITFEIKAPLMVCRQWWKYIVGSDHVMDAWNEQSYRYTGDENREYYIPKTWRKKPYAGASKQGSGEDIDADTGKILTERLERLIRLSEHFYEMAGLDDVCNELRRGYLLANFLYTKWRWSASVQSVAHFVDQRLKHDAQYEIREYASVIHDMSEMVFPNAIGRLVNDCT